MSGYLGDLNSRQQAALNQDIEWRKENGVDDMLQSYKVPEIVKQNFPGAILHPCKDGRPMWIASAGMNIKAILFDGTAGQVITRLTEEFADQCQRTSRANVTLFFLQHSVYPWGAAFLAALTPEAVQRHCVYQLEYLESLKRSSSRETGHEIETHYMVLDFDNFSIRNVYSWQVVKAITDVFQTMEDHFPECLEKCVAINAPSFFPILWKLIRPFLTQRTAEKVKVYGKADGWREVLLSIIDGESLPAHWGGSMVGPGNDPRCRHKVNYGGRFEEGLDRSESLFAEAGVEQRTIGRRDRWECHVGVTKAGSRISWRYQVDGGDLAFGLRLLGVEPLLPLRRGETCSETTQEGSWFCDAPGTCEDLTPEQMETGPCGRYYSRTACPSWGNGF